MPEKRHRKIGHGKKGIRKKGTGGRDTGKRAPAICEICKKLENKDIGLSEIALMRYKEKNVTDDISSCTKSH